MLSDRRQKVLAALIEEYVARALPVGSRTLTERYQLGVSPATVRNELSVLEDGGYIAQPHTSAGRIPTDQGYRAFVDDLLSQEGGEQEDERCQEAADKLRKSASELDDLVEQTSEALTRLTDCLSIVLAPSVLDLHIKQLSLISANAAPTRLSWWSPKTARCSTARWISPKRCPATSWRACSICSTRCSAATRCTISSTDWAGACRRRSRDPLVRMTLDEVLSCLREGEGSRAHSLGFSSLLSQPEFSQSEAAAARHAGARGRHGVAAHP